MVPTTRAESTGTYRSARTHTRTLKMLMRRPSTKQSMIDAPQTLASRARSLTLAVSLVSRLVEGWSSPLITGSEDLSVPATGSPELPWSVSGELGLTLGLSVDAAAPPPAADVGSVR